MAGVWTIRLCLHRRCTCRGRSRTGRYGHGRGFYGYLLAPDDNPCRSPCELAAHRGIRPHVLRTEKAVFAANAMTEPQGGADIENMGILGGKTIRTTARFDGDEWVINGHKLWPTNSGGVAKLFGVPCTTKLGSNDPKDFALIFVPADAKGVTQGGPYEKAGMAADKNGDIWFEDVRVPSWYRAHGPGMDAQVFREIIPWGLVGSMGISCAAPC